MKTGSYEEVLAKVTDFLKNETKTETVVGQEFKLGEFTCVPVIKVGMGFGFGGGEGEGNAPNKGGGHGEGAGAGAGMGIVPMGFLVARDSKIEFVPAGTSHGLSAAFEKIPDLLEKYWSTQKKEPQTAGATA
jgi:uncharacterized spore protein YtfJ